MALEPLYCLGTTFFFWSCAVNVGKCFGREAELWSSSYFVLFETFFVIETLVFHFSTL